MSVIVRCMARHPVDLADGYQLNPGETHTVDDTIPYNATLLALGFLAIDGTGGALPPVEEPVVALRGHFIAPAKGDVIFFDGDAWVRLPHGGVGEVLHSGSDSVDPYWAGLDLSQLDFDPATQSELDAHNASHTVHGIANTADLATKSGDVATEAAARAAHAALTTTAHGGIVASTDARLTDTRTPTDGSVTSAKLAAGAVTNTKIQDGTIGPEKLSFSAASVADVTSDVSVLHTRLDAVESFVPEETFGYFNPLFTDLTDFASSSGLAIAAGGGIIAASAGVQGTGFINLPKEIDTSKPFRMSVLLGLDVNADEGANVISAGLGYGAVGVTSPEQRGFIVATESGGYVNYNSIAANQFFHAFTPPVGARLVASLVFDPAQNSDRLHMSMGMYGPDKGVLGPAGVTTPQTWGATVYRNDKLITQLGWDGIFKSFDRMARIQINTKSVNHKILGVFVSQAGTYNVSGRVIYPSGKYGTRDSRFKPRAAVKPKYDSVDDGAQIFLPPQLDGANYVDLLYCDHPNASDEAQQHRADNGDAGATLSNLISNGYMTAIRRGDPASYTSALSSPWGAAAGIQKRKDVIDDICSRYPVRHVYWFGPSAGFVSGLALAMAYPNLFRAMIGFSPVTNLGYAHDSEGYGSTINTAYGVSFANAAALAAYDPHQGGNPSKFRRIPIKIWHGDADTNIHKTQHADAFKALVEAQGGSVSVVNCPGGGHLDATFWSGVDKAQVLAFLQANS